MSLTVILFSILRSWIRLQICVCFFKIFYLILFFFFIHPSTPFRMKHIKHPRLYIAWACLQNFEIRAFSSSENLRAEGLYLPPTPGVSSQLWRAVRLPHSPGPAWNSSPRLPTPSNQDFQVCDSFPFSSGRAWTQRADCVVSKHSHGCHSWISIRQLCLCSPSFRVLTSFHLGNLVSAP